MTFKRLFAVALLALVGVVGWRYWQGRIAAQHAAAVAAARPPVKVPVTVTTIAKADFPVYLDGLGTVQPYSTVTVRTRVDGQINQIFIKEGQLVNQGDLLLRIDPRPYQAVLDQATAKRQQDEANLANANVNLDRDTKLAKQAFASKQTLDNETAAVRQLQAQVAADTASISSAQTQVSYTEIRAPVSGRIGFFTLDQGNIVSAGSTTGIMTITQVQPIAVVFTAPETQLPRIYKAKQAGEVETAALTADQSQVLAKGKLTVIDNQVASATGTIGLKATFDNKDNILWPGLSVDTRLLVETLKQVVVAPDDVVEHGQSGLYAFVIDQNDHAHIQPITVSETGMGKVVISKGLSAGDKVVVAGQYRLQEGTLVALDESSKKTDVAQEQ